MENLHGRCPNEKHFPTLIDSLLKAEGGTNSVNRKCNPLRRSCVSSARNAGESAICPARAQPSAEIVRVERAPDKSHSRLHFAYLTRTISAEGCAGKEQIALSPAFRALDARDLRRRFRAHIALSPAFHALGARDLRRGLRARRTNRTLACISRARDARSPQSVARARRTDRPLACISPSAEIVRVENAKCRRECDLSLPVHAETQTQIHT